MSAENVVIDFLEKESVLSGCKLSSDVIEKAKQAVSSRLTDRAQYEVQLSSGPRNIPEYISKLHIERNLNMAIDCLDAVDKLLAEYRAYKQNEVVRNYIKAVLEDIDSDEASEQHEALVQELNLNEYLENHTIRLGHKIVDLLDYLAAVEYGHTALFKTPAPSEPAIELGPLARTREVIRHYLLAFKELKTREREKIITISLKCALNVKGAPLASGWGKRDSGGTLAKNNSCFDLCLYELTKDVDARINRIGVTIIDKESGMRRAPSKTANPDCLKHRNIKIQYDGNGTSEYAPEDSRAAQAHTLGQIDFGSVPGTWGPNNITWATSSALLNSPLRKKWKLLIEKEGIVQYVFNRNVQDILVHFHVSHL